MKQSAAGTGIRGGPLRLPHCALSALAPIEPPTFLPQRDWRRRFVDAKNRIGLYRAGTPSPRAARYTSRKGTAYL